MPDLHLHQPPQPAHVLCGLDSPHRALHRLPVVCACWFGLVGICVYYLIYNTIENNIRTVASSSSPHRGFWSRGSTPRRDAWGRARARRGGRRRPAPLHGFGSVFIFILGGMYIWYIRVLVYIYMYWYIYLLGMGQWLGGCLVKYTVGGWMGECTARRRTTAGTTLWFWICEGLYICVGKYLCDICGLVGCSMVGRFFLKYL